MNGRIYIVTGAAGFLGGTVCRQLLERGENVRAFVLPGEPNRIPYEQSKSAINRRFCYTKEMTASITF